MVFDADLVSLLLYCVQQLGVVLGVGAQTIMLIAYLVSLRDGAIDSKEAQFARAVRRVLNVGIVLIVTSGVGVVLFHVLRGEEAILLEPAFIFKWLLIMAITVFALSMSREYAHPLWQGAVGGTWYALFLVHILAPVITWSQLLELFGFWLVGSVLVWFGLLYSVKRGKIQLPKPEAIKIEKTTPERIIDYSPPPAPIPQVATPPPPKPTPLPVLVMPTPAKIGVIGTAILNPPKPLPNAHVPTPPIPQKPAALNMLVPKAPIPQKPHEAPAPKKEEHSDLPTIRVMPRTPEELSVEHRGAVVALKAA